MSTPAAAALSDAGSTGATGTPPAAPTASGTVPAPAATQFWKDWSDPSLKETRDWVANKNYADVPTLAKTAHQWEREAATLRAGKGYPTAGPDGKVDPNAVKAWNTLTGVPEIADKYDFSLPADPMPMMPGLTQKLMAEEFHKAGVPAAMAKTLGPAMIDNVLGKLEEQTRAFEDTQSAAALKELEMAWGPNYQERLQMGARGKQWLAQEAGGLNDTQLRVLESVMGTDKFMTAMWKIGAGNSEARFAGDNANSGNRFQGGASEAQARLEQIMADRSANKISDMQYRDLAKPGGEIDQLRDKIVAGMAQQ